MSREPHLMSKRGRNWTTLDCEVGKHRGIFTITRTPQGWACHDCLVKLVAPTLTADEVETLREIAKAGEARAV